MPYDRRIGTVTIDETCSRSLRTTWIISPDVVIVYRYSLRAGGIKKKERKKKLLHRALRSYIRRASHGVYRSLLEGTPLDTALGACIIIPGRRRVVHYGSAKAATDSSEPHRSKYRNLASGLRLSAGWRERKEEGCFSQSRK